MATNLFIDHGQPHFHDVWHNSWLLDETSALELKLCRCKVGQLHLKGADLTRSNVVLILVSRS